MKINVMKNEEKHNYCGELEDLDDINSPEDEEWARIINEKFTSISDEVIIKQPKIIVTKGKSSTHEKAARRHGEHFT